MEKLTLELFIIVLSALMVMILSIVICLFFPVKLYIEKVLKFKLPKLHEK